MPLQVSNVATKRWPHASLQAVKNHKGVMSTAFVAVAKNAFHTVFKDFIASFQVAPQLSLVTGSSQIW